MQVPPFDAEVFDAAAGLSERGVQQPEALFLLGCGVGVLPGRLEGGGRTPLAGLPGVPEAWADALLHYGQFNGLSVWMLEDAPHTPAEGDPAWVGAFPVWLAAAAGCSTLVHTSAGSALPRASEPLAVGTIALVSDHVNLSGDSPLVGVGESRLGPLFPDQTRVHDTVLRRSALATAQRLGLHGVEAVVACVQGPSLETPAERRWFATAGCDVSVQRLATPLIGAAHAGLGTLSLVIVANADDGPIDVAEVVAVAARLAPSVDDLLWELASEVRRQTQADLEEQGT